MLETQRKVHSAQPEANASRERRKASLRGPFDFKPLEAPPLPISLEKQQKLNDLLPKYQADTISPEEYHKQRAAILAGP
jgi:hypothetical protein